MINIHYGGCDATHSEKFRFDIPNGHDSWLLLLTHTPAIFWVEGELKEYPPYSAILYRPHQKIFYKASSDKYINDWMRFDCDEPFVNECLLPFGIPFVLNDPDYFHSLFKLIVAENFFNNEFKQSSIDNLLKIMFNKMLEAYYNAEISSQYSKLFSLRKDIHNRPGYKWTVSYMADFLHLSPGYLQTIYKKVFGISCIDDVIASRINLAKEYLMHSTQPISNISFVCGYNNVEHFCRQFKQITGFTPGKFRKQSSDSVICHIVSNKNL